MYILHRIARGKTEIDKMSKKRPSFGLAACYCESAVKFPQEVRVNKIRLLVL